MLSLKKITITIAASVVVAFLDCTVLPHPIWNNWHVRFEMQNLSILLSMLMTSSSGCNTIPVSRDADLCPREAVSHQATCQLSVLHFEMAERQHCCRGHYNHKGLVVHQTHELTVLQQEPEMMCREENGKRLLVKCAVFLSLLKKLKKVRGCQTCPHTVHTLSPR